MSKTWSKVRIKLPAWLYTLLYRFMHWYAMKILRVPFCVAYSPEGDKRRIMGITYAWTMDYAHTIHDSFKTLQELADAKERIVQLENVIEAAKKGKK